VSGGVEEESKGLNEDGNDISAFLNGYMEMNIYMSCVEMWFGSELTI